MAKLILGPLLRHVGVHDATVWVETDAPCEVEVLGHRTRTFHVEGHHYALVVLEGLEQGGAHEYAVHLDGRRVWPSHQPHPRSVIRTIDPDVPFRLVFGSCRFAAPHEPPWTLSPDGDPRGHGVDSLAATARRMTQIPEAEWPEVALFLGDQVYADEVSPGTLEFIRGRRSTAEPPGEEVADFEEYTRLYRDSWTDPDVRWFLSTVASAMLFDDHDVHDDWNISRAWVRRMRATPWWEERIVGAYVSYWVYQHIGNLSPRELREDELFGRVQEANDAGPLLREFARRAAREPDGMRWSFCRDVGRTRILGIDCRAGRVLDPARRRIVDDEEWSWIAERCRGDFDHLVLGMSDPYLLSLGAHDFEAWNEAVCRGAWGHWWSARAERIREALDLDHWAAFETSFRQLTELIGEVGSGAHGGTPPASIVALSGDVHNAYLARVAFRRRARVASNVYQAVCSPMRNPLPARERLGQRVASGPVGTAIGRTLAALARVRRPEIRWRYEGGPWFGNQIGTLEIEGRRALLRLEGAAGRSRADERLTPLLEYRLA